MNARDAVISYIEQIIGHAPVIKPLPDKKTAKVPVYLVELYDLFGYIRISQRLRPGKTANCYWVIFIDCIFIKIIIGKVW